jgi:hypothetical protein
MGAWSLSSGIHQPNRFYRPKPVKKASLLLSLCVPLALALMSITAFLFIIKKVMEGMQ